MPVSMVCESTANVNAALRESLGSTNACTITSAAVGDDVKAAIVSANGSAATTNKADVCDSLQNKLVASAKIALFTKIEYEEATSYGHSVLDNLKSKYNVLKPSLPGYNGEINRNSQMTIYNQNENSSADINGNSTTAAAIKLRSNPNELPQPKRILYPRENVQIGWEATGRAWEVGVGMINVGNTCYLNSTLQALFHVPSLANWLISDSAHMERCDAVDTGCIICAMSKTLLASQSSLSSIRPHFVYSKLKSICKHLVMGRQEDAHEFLRYLVEAMEKSYLARFRNFKEFDQFSKETTPLNQILGGYLKSAVRCLACNHVSVTFQHFQDLLLDIRKADTIEEALEVYFSRERLEDMGYKCEACKKKVSATKQFTLERAPIVLCIQLKRFSMLGTKLNKQITLAPRLDLTKYSSKRITEMENKNDQPLLTYRLVAMVTHLGATQHCGHYTAIGLTESGTYYNYDDSYVRPISVQNVCNTNAYIIFYEMDSQQPYKAIQQQLQTQSTRNTCTQINDGNISSNDSIQIIKMNGYPMKSNNDNGNVQSQRLIGPQLPPSKLSNYSETTTTIAHTYTNILTNSNKMGLSSHCSNSSPSSAAPLSVSNINNNNSKIMIHFKNNNISSTTANSIKLSTTTCSSMIPITATITASSTLTTSTSMNNNNNSVFKNSKTNMKNDNHNNSSDNTINNNPASRNYNGYFNNETLIKTSAQLLASTTTVTVLTANCNKSSFCFSSNDDTISTTTQTVSSQTTLPSMPKLNVDINAAKTTTASLIITTTTTTAMVTSIHRSPNCNSNNHKQKSAVSASSSSTSAIALPFKSLVPYGSSETDEESDCAHGNVNSNTTLKQVSRDQSPKKQQNEREQQQKRLQTTMNSLNRRQNNNTQTNLNPNQLQHSSSSGVGSNSDQDDVDHSDCNRLKRKQKKFTESCVKVAKRKVTSSTDSIDKIFDTIKCNSNSNNVNGALVTCTNGSLKYMKKSMNEDQQSKLVSSTKVPIDTNKMTISMSSSSSDEENDCDDKNKHKSSRNGNNIKKNASYKKCKLASPSPPSPVVIETKTGPWQVTVDSPDIPEKSFHKVNNATKNNNESKTTTLEKSIKNHKNPFATNTTTANRFSAISKRTALSTENLSLSSNNSKRLKKESGSPCSSTISNLSSNNNYTMQTCNGNSYGYQRNSASDSAINELLKQSHQGYGAPVLTWNGQQTEIEKEINSEKRAERQRDWQNDEDNDNNNADRNGRQKKPKNSGNKAMRPSDYNPFQEQQNNQKRWKQHYQQQRHPDHKQYHYQRNNNHYTARHYNHITSNSNTNSRHTKHSFQRNKFKFQRFPYKFSYNYNRRNKNSTNSSGGSNSGSGSNGNAGCRNTQINITSNNNLNYRRNS